MIDSRLPRFSQAVQTVALVIAFLFDLRWIVLVLAGILVAAAAAKFLKEPVRGQADAVRQDSGMTVWERCAVALKAPSFALHMLAFLAMLVALTAYLTWMPTLLFRKFGMDLTSAGLNAMRPHAVVARKASESSNPAR